MQLRTLASLLVLQCWVPLALARGSLVSVGTVKVDGLRLRVFEIDGVQVAQPTLRFKNACDSLRYNHMYQKYQLVLPLKVHFHVLPAANSDENSNKVAGHARLTRLRVRSNRALSSKDAGLTLMVQLKRHGQAELIFLCDTFIRCQRLKDEVSSNPEELRHAVRFVPVGRVKGNSFSLGSLRSANLPTFHCAPNRWVVFQRRVDGSLSFAQNWDAYVKGFGNPNSNYWMGLDQLFAMTVTSSKNGYAETSRCRLRMEVEDFKGRRYWGEYKLFEVLGPEQNYLMRVGLEVAGSQFDDFVNKCNEMQFSTYDRDHDTAKGSCSQFFGYGGWWYNGCHAVNLNGAYASDKVVNSPTYNSAWIKTVGQHVPMKRTLMKFNCD